MSTIRIQQRDRRTVPERRAEPGGRTALDRLPSSLSAVPDPVLRDSLEDAPAWGGGIHTWCRCGCTGDEDHFRNVSWRVDFPFIEE